MNLSVVIYYVGSILLIEAVLMIVPLGISMVLGEACAALGFGVAIGLCLTLGLIMFLRKPKTKQMYSREGLVIVSGSWLLMSLLGALPFYISGEIPSFIDSFFETVSGFTTTGASILTEVEHLSKGLLYWRSFTHWVGGMGVLVFMLAIVPRESKSNTSMQILKAESPGPIIGKLAPQMGRSTQILYGIYIFMTLLQVILLRLGGMPLFDSLTTAYATAGTGGFAITNASTAAYPSVYLQNVIAVFMLLFGVNFNVYYLILVRRFKQAFGSEELHAYLSFIAVATLAIAFNVLNLYQDFGEALHHSFFQVASIITTTGFSTVNFNHWPEFSRFLLVLLMVVGASAGSTGGGIKTARVLILFKTIKRQLRRMLHPDSVMVLRLDGRPISKQVQHDTSAFFIVYCLIIGVSTLLVSVDNMSFATNITAVLATINNIGPGLDVVGPVGNFSAFSPFSKLVLCFDMLAGRLEIFPVLFLFAPSVWKRARLRNA